MGSSLKKKGIQSVLLEVYRDNRTRYTKRGHYPIYWDIRYRSTFSKIGVKIYSEAYRGLEPFTIRPVLYIIILHFNFLCSVVPTNFFQDAFSSVFRRNWLFLFTTK